MTERNEVEKRQEPFLFAELAKALEGAEQACREALEGMNIAYAERTKEAEVRDELSPARTLDARLGWATGRVHYVRTLAMLLATELRVIKGILD